MPHRNIAMSNNSLKPMDLARPEGLVKDMYNYLFLLCDHCQLAMQKKRKVLPLVSQGHEPTDSIGFTSYIKQVSKDKYTITHSLEDVDKNKTLNRTRRCPIMVCVQYEANLDTGTQNTGNNILMIILGLVCFTCDGGVHYITW